MLLLLRYTKTDISKTISYIVRGIELNQNRLLDRAIRQNVSVRRYVTAPVLETAVLTNIPASNPLRHVLLASTSQIPGYLAESASASVHEASSPSLPEVDIFLGTLVVTTLLRHNLLEAAATLSVALVDYLKKISRRSLDIFAAKAYYYYSLVFERLKRLESIRSELLQSYRTACLHRDELSQAVLFNLILRY